MRAVIYSDLATAARALLPVPPHERSRICAQIIADAELADKYTKRLGKPHPQWGDGTLMSAARRYVLAAERTLSDREFGLCVRMVMGTLAQHQRMKACKSWLHTHIKN